MPRRLEFGESAVMKPVKSSIYAGLLTAGSDLCFVSDLVRNKECESLQEEDLGGDTTQSCSGGPTWEFSLSCG